MSLGRPLAILSLALLAFTSVASPARAQEVMSKESAAVVKASFLADLETLRGKFVGLAEAFPQDKYTWRPMDGVRSVSEVLMLAALEGYSFIPSSFGAKAADLGSREEAAKLRTLSRRRSTRAPGPDDRVRPNQPYRSAVEQVTLMPK